LLAVDDRDLVVTLGLEIRLFSIHFAVGLNPGMLEWNRVISGIYLLVKVISMKYLALGLAVGPIIAAILTIFGGISISASFVIFLVFGALLLITVLISAHGGTQFPWTLVFPIGYASGMFLISFVFRTAIESLK